MRQLLKLQPGGVQVSDNAMAWEATGTVVVWPSPGERVAPKGLGSNVRRNAARRMGVEPLTDNSIQDVYGCPSGTFVKDYYCFYTDINFGGRRLQFTGATGSGSASNWGFDNQTTGWVNTDTDVRVHAYNTTTGSGWLWDEPENARVSYVGDTKNDLMSWWTTTPS